MGLLANGARDGINDDPRARSTRIMGSTVNYANRLPAQAIRHRLSIEAAVAKRAVGTSLEQRVMRSWRRCLERHALDPAQSRQPSVVDAAELCRRRASLGGAAAVVRAAMLRFSTTFDRTACAIFTDAEGVILYYAAAPAFAERARGLRAGAVWSESEQGTNGMGTCLIEREPVIIEQGQHFLAQNTGLTCFAMPVFHRQGQLLGALDISCNNVPPHGPMLALLDLAVLDIENRLLLQQPPGESVLYFSPNRSHIGTALEGIVSVDSCARVTGANRTAIRLLGARAPEQVFGRSTQELLGISKDRVLVSDNAALFRCRPSIDQGGYEYYYCRVRAPAAAYARVTDGEVRPVRTTIAAAERHALLEALQRSDWNISRAARSLGIGRKTLYRKLAKHQLGPAMD